jgi:deoxyribonuclease V
MWPTDAAALAAYQERLAGLRPEPWTPGSAPLAVAGCWLCFSRGQSGPGEAGDPGWAAAVLARDDRAVEEHVVAGAVGGAYVPGLFALRAGPLLDRAVRGLASRPDVLLVDATSRDHPRRAGLALLLGAELDLPTVGVTHRPLIAEGDWPADHRGATSPLRIGDEVVARWVRTRLGVRPLVVHPGWRVDLDTAVDVVLATTTRWRTPAPLRLARRAARTARAAADVEADRGNGPGEARSEGHRQEG